MKKNKLTLKLVEALEFKGSYASKTDKNVVELNKKIAEIRKVVKKFAKDNNLEYSDEHDRRGKFADDRTRYFVANAYKGKDVFVQTGHDSQHLIMSDQGIYNFKLKAAGQEYASDLNIATDGKDIYFIYSWDDNEKIPGVAEYMKKHVKTSINFNINESAAVNEAIMDFKQLRELAVKNGFKPLKNNVDNSDEAVGYDHDNVSIIIDVPTRGSVPYIYVGYMGGEPLLSTETDGLDVIYNAAKLIKNKQDICKQLAWYCKQRKRPSVPLFLLLTSK